MSIDSDALADRLTAATGGDPTGWLWPVLLRRLATGHPGSLDDLAQATGRHRDEVRNALAALPDTEYDEHGRVVGHGLTLRETPHRFTVAGRQLYTWCALDTLIFPTVLDQPARVVSPTPGGGARVRLHVDPIAGVTALEPATAVVSVLIPDRCDSVRAAFCDQVHFFATPTTAQDWLTDHPGGTVLTVAEALELGRRLAQDLTRGPGCC
ncbi:organomercurial lyase MerB [Pseudonocardia dioxanivorans]|uniref:organomercurial lyase MerB n=1 Tax=Pseudonocardia dioxanivorans TaxID=240495 RepID=UPI000CD2D03F|nr:organomercurial lyase MerB [Pseudonocardia dioxanivorans]